MIDAIDGSVLAPNHYLKDSSSNFTIEVNPTFVNWRNCEQALFTFLNSTLSPSVLALSIGKKNMGKVFGKCSRNALHQFLGQV